MPRKFKLQNGLTATLRSLQAPAMKKFLAQDVLASHVIKKDQGQVSCVVAVQIDKETIWLVFYSERTKETVVHKLETDMENILNFNCVHFAVHHNDLWYRDKEFIFDCIRNKTPPSIAVLLKLPALLEGPH